MKPAANESPVIVCVDDDMLVLRSLREQLQRGLDSACDIELAGSGQEALQLLDELAADGADVQLLISDHVMPGLRGAQLMAQAHQRYPEMLKIMLTGQADGEAVAHAVNHANLYRMLGKPWQEHDLVLTVREALRSVQQDRDVKRHAAALASVNRELAHSVQLLHATMNATVDGILVIDECGRVVQCNRQFLDLWRVPAGVAVAGPADPLLSHLRSVLVEPRQLALHGVPVLQPVVLALADQRLIEYSSRAHCIDNRQTGTVYSFRDVTERERSVAVINRQATSDTVTGMANRFCFDNALERAVERARENGSLLAVMFIDLDRFKRINDELGHAVGDELLRCVAERMRHCVRDDDLVARWGGDEFTILLPRIQSAEEVALVAQRILDTLKSPLRIGEHSLQVSASIGIAVHPDEGGDATTLLKRADLALYRVKENGRNGFLRYCDDPRPKDDSVLTLEAELYHAFEHGELELHYQPQVDTASGVITHVEALARWHHPRHGWIAPGRFMPLLDEMGLAVPFGEWVLAVAAAQAARWHAEGYRGLGVAVNISASQVKRSDLRAATRRILAQAGLDPHQLEIEITEAFALRDPEKAAGVLRELQEDGIRIALDDFGAGFASLSYLKQLPCQTLKIDRMFTSELGKAPRDAAVVSAVVTLARGFGLRVVAEGVETAETRTCLQELGCWNMQGYLFSRAVPAAVMSEQLRRYAAQGGSSTSNRA